MDRRKLLRSEIATIPIPYRSLAEEAEAWRASWLARSDSAAWTPMPPVTTFEPDWPETTYGEPSR